MDKKHAPKIMIDTSNKPFYTDNISILHNENQVIIDFKQTTPRMDVVHGEQKISFITNHNTIMMNPKLAKSTLQVLKDSLEKYEKEFGEVKIPKKQPITRKKVETTGMNYIG